MFSPSSLNNDSRIHAFSKLWFWKTVYSRLEIIFKNRAGLALSARIWIFELFSLQFFSENFPFFLKYVPQKSLNPTKNQSRRLFLKKIGKLSKKVSFSVSVLNYRAEPGDFFGPVRCKYDLTYLGLENSRFLILKTRFLTLRPLSFFKDNEFLRPQSDSWFY